MGNKFRDPRWWLAFAPVIAAMILLMALPESIQSDSWYNLVLGRSIAAHGLPTHDTLTTIAAGRSWFDQQWLAQWLFYQADRLLGLVGMAVIGNALSLSALVLLVIGTYRRGLSPLRAQTIGLVAIPSLYYYSVVRAQDWSLPCFVILLWLLYELPAHPRRAWWLAPLFLVWGNTHGAVLVGCFIVLLWVITEIVPLIWTERHLAPEDFFRAIPWRWLGLLPLSFLPALITPYGLNIIHYYQAIDQNTAFSKVITEWEPLSATFVYNWPTLLMLLISMILLGAHWRQVKIFDRCSLLILAIAALHTTRFGIFFFFDSCWVLATIWQLHPTVSIPTAPLWLPALVMLLTVVVVIEVVYFGTQPSGKFIRSTPSAPAQVLASIERLRATDPQLKILGDEQVSNYLLWARPNLAGHIALDSRLELLTSAELLSFGKYLDVINGWQPYLNHYQVAVTLIRAHPRLARALDTVTGWHIVYRDSQVIVVARNDLGP